MTKQEIINAINAKIVGQGNMLDVAGILPSVLLGIIDLIDSTASTLATKEEVDDFEDFDATTSYSTNDIVRYNNKLYKFTSDHNGAWTGTDVQQTNVVSIVS